METCVVHGGKGAGCSIQTVCGGQVHTYSCAEPEGDGVRPRRGCTGGCTRSVSEGRNRSRTSSPSGHEGASRTGGPNGFRDAVSGLHDRVEDGVAHRRASVPHSGVLPGGDREGVVGDVSTEQRRPVSLRNGLCNELDARAGPPPSPDADNTATPGECYNTGIGPYDECRQNVHGGRGRWSYCPLDKAGCADRAAAVWRPAEHHPDCCKAQGHEYTPAVPAVNGSCTSSQAAGCNNLPLTYVEKLRQTLLAGCYPLRLPHHNATSIPLPEFVELCSSEGVGYGLKAQEGITRPPAERLKFGEIATISTHRLNLRRAQSLNPDYLWVLDLLSDSDVFEQRLLGDPATGRIRVSRSMGRHKAKLADWGVVRELRETEERIVMPMFTVPKKDDKLRLIMDCRRVNRVFEKPPAMDLPNVHDLIDRVLEHEIAAQADGKNYFYQFPLSVDVGKYFCARFGGDRGEFTDMAMTVMPMGWSWAPCIAQRTSNTLIGDSGISLGRQLHCPGGKVQKTSDRRESAFWAVCITRTCSLMKRSNQRKCCMHSAWSLTWWESVTGSLKGGLKRLGAHNIVGRRTSSSTPLPVHFCGGRT
eukprot:PhM_4_TR14151/c3_g2_i1/m.51604